jgi:hypothetical protein
VRGRGTGFGDKTLVEVALMIHQQVCNVKERLEPSGMKRVEGDRQLRQDYRKIRDRVQVYVSAFDRPALRFHNVLENHLSTLPRESSEFAALSFYKLAAAYARELKKTISRCQDEQNVLPIEKIREILGEVASVQTEQTGFGQAFRNELEEEIVKVNRLGGVGLNSDQYSEPPMAIEEVITHRSLSPTTNSSSNEFAVVQPGSTRASANQVGDCFSKPEDRGSGKVHCEQRKTFETYTTVDLELLSND